MDRESVERLRFDRRLACRRDWVDASEVEAHFDALEDVSEKMTTAAELEAELEAARNAAPAEEAPPSFGAPATESTFPGSAPAAPAAVPVAGDFSSSATSTGPSTQPGGTAGDFTRTEGIGGGSGSSFDSE